MAEVAGQATAVDQLQPLPTVKPRPLPFPPPEVHSLPPQQLVWICHPGYSDDENILITINAVDHQRRGIHFGMAHIACGIIAGNRWDGYFTQAKDGPRLDFENDDGLPAGQYYCHLPSPVGNKDGMSFPSLPLVSSHPTHTPKNGQNITNTQSSPALHTGSSRIETSRPPGKISPNGALTSPHRMPPVGLPNMLWPPG